MLARLFGFTAMPQHGFEHAARAAIVQQAGVAVDVLDQPGAPQRRGFPLLAIGGKVGAVVGEALAHVVQQQVGVRPNALAAQRRAGQAREGALRGGVAGLMAGGALRFGKQGLAAQHLYIFHIAPCRRCQRGLVEHHVVKGFIVDFYARLALCGGAFAAGRAQAIGLGGRAGFLRKVARGDAHVADKSTAGLVGNGGDVGFPAKTPQHHLARRRIPHLIRLAFDGAGRSGLVGCIGQDVGLGNGFEQADTYQLRCNARADHHLRVHRAIAQVGKTVLRLQQLIRRAVGKLAGHGFVAQRDAAFGLDILHGGVVELVAIHRLVQRAAARVLAGNRQANQQRYGGVLRLAQAVDDVGRRTAPVLHVATAAGARNKVRPQAIARLGRGWRFDPVAPKKRVANRKARALGVF